MLAIGWLHLGLATLAWARAPWSAQRLPNPITSPETCGNVQPSHVCDPDDILRSHANVTKALNALERDYTYPGCGGYEMGVVIVNRVEGGSQDDVKHFAKDTMDRWGVGKAACNNGILEAISVQDRHVYIATGRGAKEHIPDKELIYVIQRMKPLLRNQQYAEAIEQSISDIAIILSGKSIRTFWEKYGPYILVGSIVGIWACMFCYSKRKASRYNRARCALKQLDLERKQPYEALSCPICLETFKDTSHLSTKLLPCGHTFHETCVNTWTEQRHSCPICRKSIEPADPQKQRLLAANNSTSSNYEDEYRFRIQRAQFLYPEFITMGMAERWQCDGPGVQAQLAADDAFIRQSPNYGSSGSSSSGGDFGGGVSAGGGGAGGSW